MNPRILARRPSPNLAAGELTHLHRVPVDPDLALAQWHGYLKSAGAALPDGTIIGRRENLDDPGVFPAFLEVPEEHGTAVVDLGYGALLMSAEAPQTAALLRARGFDVVSVPITEFEKLEGCVTCLSVRIRSAPEGASERFSSDCAS